ncbi:hypothetical protein F4778DRAFT_720101 [Xylariomycetidae sp. FL2044]|nr:hypothetical protein F4778DRAFT_720101 [Xylariomycetidae sp. FL2044]
MNFITSLNFCFSSSPFLLPFSYALLLSLTFLTRHCCNSALIVVVFFILYFLIANKGLILHDRLGGRNGYLSLLSICLLPLRLCSDLVHMLGFVHGSLGRLFGWF